MAAQLGGGAPPNAHLGVGGAGANNNMAAQLGGGVPPNAHMGGVNPKGYGAPTAGGVGFQGSHPGGPLPQGGNSGFSASPQGPVMGTAPGQNGMNVPFGTPSVNPGRPFQSTPLSTSYQQPTTGQNLSGPNLGMLWGSGPMPKGY